MRGLLLLLALVLCAHLSTLVAAEALTTETTRALAELANTYPELRDLPVPWIGNYTGGANHCAWTGITCDKVSKITKISFSYTRDGIQISGPLIQEWFNFTSLTILELQGQDFYGDAPSRIQNRAEFLKTLIISQSPRLSGNFPSFEDLIGDDVPYVINKIDFHGNNFSGPFPNLFLNPGVTGGVVYLSSLDFSSNRFSGSIEPNCTHPPYSVYLAHNELSGTIPSCLWQVKGTLDLSHNQFEGDAPISRASEVRLANNNFSNLGPLLASSSLVYTSVLDVSFNQFTSTSSFAPHAGFNFYLFDASNSGLSGPLTSEWGQGKVKYFLAPNNAFTSLWAPTAFLSYLLTMDLTDNQIGSIPSGFGAAATSLNALYLGNNNLTGTINIDLLALPALSMLSLSGNRLETIEGLFESSKLSVLDLSSNNFSGPALDYVRQVTFINQLAYLDISYNNFELCDPASLPGDALNFTATGSCSVGHQSFVETITSACVTAWEPCSLTVTPIEAPSVPTPPPPPPGTFPPEDLPSPFESNPEFLPPPSISSPSGTSSPEGTTPGTSGNPSSTPNGPPGTAPTVASPSEEHDPPSSAAPSPISLFLSSVLLALALAL